MARPKHSIQDIVSSNYRFIHDYFERAIQHQRIFKYYSDEAHEAKEEFKKILLSANKNDGKDQKHEDLIATRVTALTSWIEKYIPEDMWKRCKTAIRQHKLMVIKNQKYEYKTFRIPKDLFYDITFYAEKVSLSKFAAMKQAIDVASKMLEANENKKSKK